MKEGISYSFLLNIIILFIFVCAAIVMGVFSYYRAFRANTIIVNTIEKYEGYNCYSQEEIARKLSTISYSLPYNVACADRYGKHCTPDPDKNYVVVAYNLDYDGFYDDFSNWNEHDKYMFSFIENSRGISNGYGNYTKRYQYGVYTYMYVDLPVISKLIRLSYFSKTKEMTEFRNLYRKDSTYTDLNFIPDEKIDYEDGLSVLTSVDNFTRELGQLYAGELSKRNTLSGSIIVADVLHDSRLAAQYYFEDNLQSQQMRVSLSQIVTPSSSDPYFNFTQLGCNTYVDYSKF